MKGPYSGEPGLDWHLSKESGTFYGTPSECRGQLTFINTSDSKIKIRCLDTQESTRKSKNYASLKPSHINLFARVAPKTKSCVMAELQLPLETAPGQYQATIVYGKEKHPIDITIIEHNETLISPSHIRLKGASGDKVSYQLSITNLGNLAFELGDVGMVWLREHDWIGRTLVYSLREAKEGDSFVDFGGQVLHNFRKDIIPPARIQFKPEKVISIAAGSSIVRTLSLTLPPGLKKGRRYLGFIKINENRIWLEVYCSGGETQKIQ
tara:strand:+ start:145165 stop:145962 length:798 start_codon:yes stop_codon:yes gene_type:complete